MASSIEQLLVEKPQEATPNPSEIAPFWTPLPSEYPLPFVGEGVWIFSETTQGERHEMTS